ncbi:MAG: hypothetical protein ACFB0B_17125 [Thermonemataceae bacterium]
MKKIFLAVLIGTLFTACGGKEETSETKENDETTTEETTENAGGVFKGIEVLNSIPDPVETAALIKDLGIRYDKSALNDVNKKSSYSKSHEQALNLGVYSADLAYANIYSQNQDAIDYLTAIKEMADGINISQYFDFEKIKQMTSEGTDLEELLKVTLSNLHQVNEELQKEQRGEMTVYIVSGGWLEALYLSCYVAKEAQNSTELKEYIADQKIILAQIVNLLSNNKDKSTHIANLHEQFSKIATAYEPISLVYGEVEDTENKQGDEIVVEQATDVKLNFSDADFNTLYDTIVEVRKEIIK